MKVRSIVLLSLSLTAISARSQSNVKLRELQPYNYSDNAQFGWSSAITDEFIAMGSHNSTVELGGSSFADAGIINIYKNHPDYGWVYHQNIISPRPEHFDFFGDKMVMNNQLLVIASTGYSQRRNLDHSHRAGAVFLYTLRNGYWINVAMIQEDNPNENSQFGDCVSLSGNTLLISSYQYEQNGEIKQAMYAYNVSTPSQPRLLDVYTIPSTPLFRIQFSHCNNRIALSTSKNQIELLELQENRIVSIAKRRISSSSISSIGINENWITVGIHGFFYPFYSIPGDLNTDSVIILPPNSSENYVINTSASRAKHSISPEDFRERALPYVPWETYFSEKRNCGSVEVYSTASDSIQWVQTLQANDASADDWFGSMMTLRDSTLLITALGDAEGPEDEWSSRFAGAVYLFQYSNGSWVEIEKITPPNLKAWDKFGFTVSLSENYGLIGIRFRDVNYRNLSFSNSGSGMVFRR